ncbi:hypothetical protein GCM10009096_02380 [Parasphingorhabdus litoris]|uniref:Uncharacterized protein n=1 Tax=Parasphingorhabdus litoris TaxID=394733 RepID=A0ABP3JVV9_9SPHN|nr:hypothetical protein [Parasphingorhabdus litoris]
MLLSFALSSLGSFAGAAEAGEQPSTEPGLKSQISTMSALQLATLSNPNGQSSYSTALRNRLTNEQAFVLEQIGMIFTNGQPTLNAVILAPNGTATSAQVAVAKLPTLNSIAFISPSNDREVSKEHRFSNAVVKEGKLALAICGVRQPDYDLCPMSLRDPEPLKCNLDGRRN